MIGGLLKSASRWALVAAAGVIVGGIAMPSAKAADLGGDCCADLEERVAELEATTARKGNRKRSLTISGQVHRMIMGWDDGHRRDVYYGLDNTMSSSRFSLAGTAKVTPNVAMGFEIIIEMEAGGTASKSSQFDEDGKVGTQINGAGAASFNVPSVDSYFGDARRAAWWIEDKNLGKIIVGRYDTAGVIQIIDLAGIAMAAASGTHNNTGSFLLRAKNGDFLAMTWNALGDNGYAGGRTELLRYDSPVIANFQFSASIAEAGDYWGAQLRYANEFSGFRVAAGIGYENSKDKQTLIGGLPTDPATPALAGPNNLTIDPGEVKVWGGGASLLHIASGLFVQGFYESVSYDGPTKGTTLAGGGPAGSVAATGTGYWNQQNAAQPDAKEWLVQAGISKNWFGLGNTSLYGEYGKATDWAATTPGRAFSAANLAGAVAVNNVTGSESTLWGVGLVQNVDAAASTLYLSYRHFSADVDCAKDTVNADPTKSTFGCFGTNPNNVTRSFSSEDFQVIYAGALVRF